MIAGSPTRNLLRGLAFLAPNLTGFLVFTAIPVVAVFLASMFQGEFIWREDPATGRSAFDASFVGFANFAALIQDSEFWRSLWNTVFLMLAVPLTMALSLGLALLLHQRVPGRVVFRTLLFLPTVAAGIALYMVWRQIYNPEFGLVNSALDSLGLIDAVGTRPDWLGHPTLAKPAVLLMLVWIGMGGTNMVLYIAGLSDIDPSLYEAAEIDGAGRWDRFIHITWPALRPTTFFILTTNLIGAVQIFDQVLIMTAGGPEGATTTILYYIYRNVYMFQGKLGYAAALSVVLFLLVFAVTLVNWRLNRKAREA